MHVQPTNDWSQRRRVLDAVARQVPAPYRALVSNIRKAMVASETQPTTVNTLSVVQQTDYLTAVANSHPAGKPAAVEVIHLAGQGPLTEALERAWPLADGKARCTLSNRAPLQQPAHLAIRRAAAALVSTYQAFDAVEYVLLRAEWDGRGVLPVWLRRVIPALAEEVGTRLTYLDSLELDTADLTQQQVEVFCRLFADGISPTDAVVAARLM